MMKATNHVALITLKITLDKRRKKQGNRYPIVFRITSNSSSRDIQTGFSVLENEWNFKSDQLKETHPEFEVIHPRLKELKLSLLSKLVEFQKNNPVEKDIQLVKNYLTAKAKTNKTVYSFWNDEIIHLKKANRVGGSHIYSESLIAIDKVKSLAIPFEKLDYSFLKEIETEYLSKGVKINTLSLHLRTLRAVYNKAINSKIVSFEHYPFRYYRIKKEKTRPRTIGLEEMKSYFKLSLENTSYLHDSWLIGQLMFMLIGINFKDLAMLTEADLRGDRVFYKRAKTKKLYSIKLLPKAKEIIEYFKGRSSDTLLGVLKPGDFLNKEKFTLIIRQRNKVFNAHLNKLGKTIGCKEKLTGYVFRYTWANVAKQLGYSKDLIAEALGHEYGNRVTGIYLEGYDLELVDQMNYKIFDSITKN